MAPEVSILCCAPELCRQVFPFVKPMLEAAYHECDEDLPDDLVDALESGQFQLWCVVEGANMPLAAVLTRLIPARSGLSMRLVACGGDRLFVWRHLWHHLEKYARDEGCVKIVAEARRGWARVLTGFEEKRAVIEKRI